MHKVFISHHHDNDQWYKEKLVGFGEQYSIFVDRSVDTGDIPEDWTDQQIRREIRDRYLRDSTVTVVLIGAETRRRKHVLITTQATPSLSSFSGIGGVLSAT